MNDFATFLTLGGLIVIENSNLLDYGISLELNLVSFEL